MAEQEKKTAKVPAPAKAMKYYKNTRHAGQRYLISAHEDDPTQNQYVQFIKAREKFQGDNRFVGFLATDDKDLQARVERTNGVESVTKDVYDKAVGA